MLALSPPIFRRTVGVYPSTYQDMRAVLEQRQIAKKKQGRTPALDLDALIKSGKFSLPARKTLRENTEFEVVVVDVAESPVERPKKATQARQVLL
jgi:hypothetical protein